MHTGSVATTTKTKGMRVELMTSKFGNKVFTDTLTLVGDDIPEISEATIDAPAVQIVAHRAGPQFTDIAVLVDGIDSSAAFVAKGDFDNPNWSMCSGSWITSSDSRFPSDRPVALHNRYEMETN